MATQVLWTSVADSYQGTWTFTNVQVVVVTPVPSLGCGDSAPSILKQAQAMKLRRRSRYPVIVLLGVAVLISVLYFMWELPKEYTLHLISPFISNIRVMEGVAWKDAIWTSHVGNWLSRCHEATQPVSIQESFHTKPCPADCGDNGVCHRELGVCDCSLGYTGARCDEELVLECNNPPAEGYPYGPWRVSICPATCDKRRALCFCGKGSKYPHRPAPESCGFHDDVQDWPSKPAESIIYANESAKIGWCNMNPEDFYSGKTEIKSNCDCRYDCTAGALCEFPSECVCLNQCSGNGICKNGLCKCNSEWFGIDCSIPISAEALNESLPSWLQGSLNNNKLLVRKKRPLIYVYELPFEFNVRLLEGRHNRGECVNRAYGEHNRTDWSGAYYAMEMGLLESLLSSSHRTTNGDEADYFYVPVFGACAITRADDAPYFHMQESLQFRSYFSGTLYKRAFSHIQAAYPFWNRSEGRDHIWYFPWDEGACIAPKEIWKSIMLSHWGNTNTKHKSSTTAYWPDSWSQIPTDWRGEHLCYDLNKDIIIPSWKHPGYILRAQELRSRPLKDRQTFFYFNGDLGKNYDPGRPEDSYSMGIRQKVAAEFASSPNKEGRLGKQAAPDVIVTHKKKDEYGVELSNSLFCGVFPGDGWSPRMIDSVYHGCIPVVIQDGIYQMFHTFLQHENFSVRIAEDDIPHMITILKSMNEAEVEAKFAAVQSLWQRFFNRDTILLEADRQKAKWNHTEEWASRYRNMTRDDAFSTLIQVLHYKLHNDPWRTKQKHLVKHWGLPPTCSVQHLMMK